MCRGLAVMNGYRSEQEEQSSTVGQICCLVEDNDRCKRPASNASYSKRIQKTVSQRKLKLALDVNVSEIFSDWILSQIRGCWPNCKFLFDRAGIIRIKFIVNRFYFRQDTSIFASITKIWFRAFAARENVKIPTMKRTQLR